MSTDPKDDPLAELLRRAAAGDVDAAREFERARTARAAAWREIEEFGRENARRMIDEARRTLGK